MKIERIQKSGKMVEVVIDGRAYYLDITNIKTKAEAKEALLDQINAVDDFNYTKFNLLKELEDTKL